jgi:Mg2+ and Co2+ transporter CorA
VISINLVAIAIFTFTIYSKSGAAYKQRFQLDKQLTELEKMMSGLERIQANTQVKIEQKIQEKFADTASMLKSIRDAEREMIRLKDLLAEQQDKFRLLQKELISNRVLPPV